MDSRRKIVFLALNLTRRDPRIFFRFGLSLVENNFSVDFIVGDGGKSEIVEGVNIVGLNRRSRINFIAFIYCQCDMFRIVLRKRPKVVHISEPHIILLGIYLKLKGFNVIFDLREDYIGEITQRSIVPKYASSLLVRLATQLLRNSLNFFDIVLVPDARLSGLHNLFKDRETPVTISNFPVYREFELTREDYINRKPLILYLGSVYKISRQEIILDIIRSRKDVDYVVFGKVWEEDYLNTLISQFGFNSYFHDGSDRSLVSGLLERSTIGNSVRDFAGSNFPEGSYGVIKIYEYMEAGMPIICSRVGIWEKMIEEYPCGILVDPNDRRELELAINKLVSDRNAAYEMALEGRKAIKERFNWAIEFDKYLEILKRYF